MTAYFLQSVVAVLCLCFAAKINALSESDLLPFGPNYVGLANEVTTAPHGLFNNASLIDGSVSLTVPAVYTPFRIMGVELDRKIFINFNGHITFGQRYDSLEPIPLNETNRDIIAVYFSDNDLRRENGALYHRFTTDTNDLTYADNLIHKEGFVDFHSQYCVVATWSNVKYYVADADNRSNPAFQQQNTYQVIICTDGSDGHIIFQYVDLNWSKSQDPSTKQAQAGWYFSTSPQDDNKFYTLPNTGTTEIVHIVDNSNIRDPQVNGRWMRSAPENKCFGKTDGVYAEDCTSFFHCCGGVPEDITMCENGYHFHPLSKACVEPDQFPCGENVNNFCMGKRNGRYSNTATVEENDFYQCSNGLTRLMTCPEGITFNTGNPRCTM